MARCFMMYHQSFELSHAFGQTLEDGNMKQLDPSFPFVYGET